MNLSQGCQLRGEFLSFPHFAPVHVNFSDALNKVAPADFATATGRRGIRAFRPASTGTGKTGLDRPDAQGRNPCTAPIVRMTCTRKAETEVVVAVRRVVVVAVGRAAVVGIVVPGAAANDMVGARIPSAVDNVNARHPAAQAVGVGVGDMGEQAGRRGGKGGMVHQPFGMAVFQRQRLAAEALPGAPVQTNQSGIDANPQERDAFRHRCQQGGFFL